MTDVAIVTGGAGGMGLATAKILGRTHRLVLSDVPGDRLDAAANALRAAGVDCAAVACDVTDPGSVRRLVGEATGLGELRACVHTAGLSPQMAAADRIVAVNARGTVEVARACLDAARDGFALVNVPSMGAYMLPRALSPTPAFRAAMRDGDALERRLTTLCSAVPKGGRSQLAYVLSKQFVIWYSRRMAAAFGERGARMLSVSPGSIDTEMGRLEERSGSRDMVRFAAIPRFGRPDEVAEVLAFCAGPRASYLTGADVLCDGGVTAGVRLRDLRRLQQSAS